MGKDLIARAVHAASRRRDGPFIKVNCAAIPSELLESELFGHEKAAFTGAYCRKVGRFEDANAGTICLDEIAELPLGLQAKLLHVLQDFRFSHVGGRRLIDVDTRVIAATNRDLDHAIACGEFRPDVYYRLAVVEIRIPPLRERKEEIPLLASRFLSRFNEQYRRHQQLSSEMMARLMEYSWPGNVRELENFIRRTVVLRGGQDAFEALADYRSWPRGCGVLALTMRDWGLERVLLTAQHHRASNEVLQLPDIARPGILHEARHHLG